MGVAAAGGRGGNGPIPALLPSLRAHTRRHVGRPACTDHTCASRISPSCPSGACMRTCMPRCPNIGPAESGDAGAQGQQRRGHRLGLEPAAPASEFPLLPNGGKLEENSCSCSQRPRWPRCVQEKGQSAAHPPAERSLGRPREGPPQQRSKTRGNRAASRPDVWKASEPVAKLHRHHAVWPGRSGKTLVFFRSLPVLQPKHVACEVAQETLCWI